LRNVMGPLLRVFSYLFHLILSLFLLGIAFVAGLAGKPLKLDVLPWEGQSLNHWVIALGIAGIVSVLLAVTGVFRYLFPIWAFFVFVMMLRGFFLTPFQFSAADQFWGAAGLTFGALGAFLSSLSVLHARKRR